VCTDCAEEEDIPAEVARRLGSESRGSTSRQFKGKGCPSCNGSGYKGRVGLYEVLIPSERMRALIARDGEIHEIKEVARQEGHILLIDDGWEKVRTGYTTAEELLRVLGPQDSQ
jgi:type II secretory ATPase GspE/PulE/Tfp pilus assembly ATPase PilB-like protein